MQHFDSDYMEGAHPLILEALVRTNMEKTAGYGTDPYCASAREKILAACGVEDGEVHLLIGGTQTNATVIKALLRPYEGVIAATTGHIALHEAGAIEASGHKVLTIPTVDGKISAEAVDEYIKAFRADEAWDHMVWPGMVYVSQPTEYGTLYSKAELEALSEVCHKWEIPLFVDGARLGYALASAESDVTLRDLARLCDVFYIGGTKCGAMFGEAVVIPRKGLIPHFFTTIKQQGALLAKGRMLGIQFDTLFTDDLYINIARQAVSEASRLREAFRAKGYEIYAESPTNQVFVALSAEQEAHLRTLTTFSEWERTADGRLVVRLATSWATRTEDIDELINNL
ncbi:MAG: aminotransferase class I/II-fold pyridoxal phosphate-dependent enzyme [Rikenellaceae bacterium]|nr:aminotransferase class I/II-fold pyridoxal phosphate-dependent enzyme [Rikenellaceae bacterium]